MFIAALFISVFTAKTWKQPKCPSTDKWIKKMWYVFTMEYYSAIKKNEILPFATWMDLESIMLSEISQMEKDGLCSFTHLWNLRNKQNKNKLIDTQLYCVRWKLHLWW